MTTTQKKNRSHFYTKASQMLKTGAPQDVIYDLIDSYEITREEIESYLKTKKITSAVSGAVVASKEELEIIYNTLDAKFIEQHQNFVVFQRGENYEFYIYNNGVYTIVDDLKMYSMVDSLMMQYNLLSHRTSRRKVEDTIRRISALLSRTEGRIFTEEKIEKQKYLLNVKNGLFNTETKELFPHSPEFFSTVQVSYGYDPKAVCPKFKNFIKQISNEKVETATMIQEMFGYCLVYGNPKHRVFYLYGLTARNGKSTLAKIIAHLLGTNNVSTLSLAQLAGENSSLLTSLIGKQLNISDELSSKYIDSSRLTAISSESFIEINPKYKKAFTYQIRAKFIITCNDLPRFNDSQGMKNRMISIPFHRQFSESERIENLDRLLVEEEGSGILNWALAGLDKLRKTNTFTISDDSAEDMKENMYHSNPTYAYLYQTFDFSDSFTTEYSCMDLYGTEEERGQGATIPATGFRKYHKENGIYNISSFVFAKEIARFASETKLIHRVKTSEGTMRYTGLQFKNADIDF